MSEIEIENLEIRIHAIQDNLEACKITGDIAGVEYYRGLILGLEEKLELLKTKRK